MTFLFFQMQGLGYAMKYSATHGHRKFPGKTGWWSNNLQSRDHTIVAGQASSNDVSVGKSSLLASSEWVDISLLSLNQSAINAALGNVYTCKFNRLVPKVC